MEFGFTYWLVNKTQAAQALNMCFFLFDYGMHDSKGTNLPARGNGSSTSNENKDQRLCLTLKFNDANII